MSRKLLAFALFAAAAVPLAGLAAVACPPGFGYAVPAGPPVIYVPVYPQMAAPKVHVEPKADPKPSSRAPAPLAPPRVTIEPAAFAEPTPEPPKTPAIPVPVPVPEIAKPAPLPVPEIAKPPVPETPKFTPVAKPDVPQMPIAPPTPADPKDADPIKLPTFTPKIPDGGDTNLPPLKLPTLPNLDPPTTSRSSPLTGSASVDIVPAEGKLPANGKRRVGFFNQTDRAVVLTVEGESVTLPGRHTITAEVPATFTWALDRGDPRSTTVPGGASGVEVVIRK